MNEITGMNIWLVGASSGIGLALANKLAANGNFVFVTARSQPPLQKLKETYPANIDILCGDITDQSSVNEIEQSLALRSDTLDIVLLCAGTCEYDDGPTLDMAMYRRVFDVNFFSAVACINIALPMLKRARGNIVGISSLASVVPFPRAEAYGASKSALEYFLQSLAVDLKRFGIGVTLVRPGFVKTPLTQRNDFDMPFIMSADEAANKIIDGIARRKAVFSFPWQLAWPLNFFSMFKALWLHSVANNFKKPSQI